MPTIITMTESLALLAKWIQDGQQFVHTRYGDGECCAMFGLRSESDINCDGHNYYADLGVATKRALDGFIDAHNGRQLENLIIGTNIQQHPNILGSRELDKHLKEIGAYNYPNINWTIGDVWWNPYAEIAGKEEIIRLLESLQDRTPRVVFVAKEEISDASYCMEADWVPIPAINAWDKRGPILEHCQELADNDTVFVWAAGMPGKAWAWQVYQHNPTTSHIDIGHLFDGVFGIPSRSWLCDNAPDGRVHLKYCQEVFYPYVKSFIPAIEELL